MSASNGGTKESEGLVDRNVSLLIALGASMAANSRACLGRTVDDLLESGIPMEQIQGALQIGQMVKDKPDSLMKKDADDLTGTGLSEETPEGACPLEAAREKGIDVRVPMLVAAGSAVAAGCEPCLNSVVPKLIEARVPDGDIRKAVEIGQGIKDRAATNMKEVADLLTGTNLLGREKYDECETSDERKPAACCI